MEEVNIQRDVITHFTLQGEVIGVERYGAGHINHTYLVTTTERRYVLQEMNRRVFPNIEVLMSNIRYVTEYLASRGQKTLTLVYTNRGDSYLECEDSAWRIYEFVEGAVTYQSVEDAEIFRNAAYAFGEFQNALAGFDASLLVDVIPHFHDTPRRFVAFEKALAADCVDRAKTCQAEIAFYLDQKERISLVVEGLADGSLPLRVTHNDTKLNNILMDPVTKQALAVVDLDTVMAGSLLYDFGDSIRFGASTAAEDERDLSLVHFDIDLYRAYTEGYLAAVKDSIVPREVQLLWYGAYLMTTECGMRFLTDYLSGDTYFGAKYPEHNLVRARTQMRLASEMWAQQDAMLAIAQSIYNKEHV